ncbi:MAG TPA: bifunctional phosphopantothenoylcysteine decarboxylase/phosphopantothenate--cysteine ligase CoaBC [Myxococcota bacterium]|nr:bifunctional phosphopantothenoylcysteine decarboxylase/phosphopantothenate--cysteine ligase CoaBC [Myxococcota bacterium]HRY92046.1 bifunctional phosphopantothenoylcysteine decarboxylase/phosphopantothenate--cysteine ligase CoaBC [Myxococcota bacterium]HSA24303.1 bifunctional phosphopantothenoylcysteine decarboxylase/phosphopantothenate--cysteine ligase CoaBC [Myxococcota bacterium]
MGVLEGKLVVLGVSGGIAAYRSCELARLLVKAGARVQAVLTDYAARLVGPLTFQALTGRPAEVGAGGALAQAGMDHIDLGRDAALLVVAPATANTLAKLACGLADNLLTTTVLASRAPVVLAPAMNTRMWENPLTQQNLARLLALPRFRAVGPGVGALACGEEGVGRMAEPEELLEAALAALSPQDLAGRRVLVSAGPTREPLDPVRYLSNRSSGRMGYALARVAARRGAEVVLVSGPTALQAPPGVRRVEVQTAAEMARAIRAEAGRADAVLMAAAVADFAPRRAAGEKLKKASGPPALELVPTQDILAGLGERRTRAGRPRVLVGFAAETGDPRPAARDKLRRKRLDLVVGNDVNLPGAGFDVQTNRVHLVDEAGDEELPLLSKADTAARILDRVVALLARRASRARGPRRARA